jgi:thiamine-phosphate pyrophosphorylase
VKTIPRLMLVTNRQDTRLPLLDVIQLAVQGGAEAIQVREKDLPERELASLVAAVRTVAGNATVIVNSSIDIAREQNVGLHLPEAGPTIGEARSVLGARALIGRSVHSPEGAAASDGADYLIAGHVFASHSKPDRPPIGLDGVATIVAAANLPVIAIGGIGAANAREVIERGAKGVAVMSEINRAPEAKTATESIKSQLEGGQPTIFITLNGREMEIAEGLSVQEFLHQRGYRDRLVVVEINGSIAPKSSYSTRVFQPKDSVEIVHFVGGG